MNCHEVHDLEREGEKCLAILEGEVKGQKGMESGSGETKNANGDNKLTEATYLQYSPFLSRR